MNALAEELTVATAAIRAAGAEVMTRYRSFERIEDAPADISTDADRASQEIILGRLRAAFPGDGVYAEENTPAAREGGAGRVWVVDPIDGTRGFARKNDEFSLMVGLADAGRVVLGLVLEPGIDRLTYATEGQGCFVVRPEGAEPKRCHVTDTAELAQATMSMSRSQAGDGERRLRESFGVSGAVLTYSAGIKLAQVARGETDLYLGDYLTLRDWDICAGHILVTEAGGRVTTTRGDAIEDYGHASATGGAGILATNGPLHDTALEVLASGRYRFA